MNTSLGYAKKTLTNSNVLLSGGGDKALSEFIGSLNWDSTNKKLQYKSASSTDFTDLINFGSNAFTSYTVDDFLLKSGGLMTGPLTWKDNAALPLRNSVGNILTVDAFTSGGTMGWASLDTLKSSIGLENYVTLDTALTITGSKKFSGTGDFILTIDKNNGSNAWIAFANNGTILGGIGVTNDHNAVFSDRSSIYTIWHSGNTIPYATNADTVDGYHASELFKAASTKISNGNSSNTWIRIATINIPGTDLSTASISAIFSNREVLDNTSFILTLAIRRNNTTSAADIEFYYNAIQSTVPRTITVRSDDNQNFYVYIQTVANTWTTYYYVTNLITEGNVTFENVGTTSPISGSITNVDASKGGNVLYANSAGSVNWSNVSSKPETATRWPSWLEVTDKPDTFTPSYHTHDYLPLSGGTMTGGIVMGTDHYIYGVQESKGSMLYFDGNRTVIGSYGATSTLATHLRSKTGHLTCGTDNTASYTIWDSGNDGSGSGLDADKLDDLDSNEFPILSLKGTEFESGGTCDVTEVGTYYSPSSTRSASLTNTPITTSNFKLWHLATGQDAYPVLIAIAYNEKVYFRGNSNGTWRDWKRFAFRDSDITGTAANVTGTVEITHGGTGATTRLDALKALTNENVSTNAQYFLTVTSLWANGGYTSVADAKTILAMTGATNTTAGVAGVVPAPPSDGYDTKFLRADGTWSVPATSIENVASATKLQTARTLWGLSFDGTANVSGNMTDVGTISASGNNTITKTSGDAIFAAVNNNGRIELITATNRGIYDRTNMRWLIGTDGTNSWLDCGNVGIGTSSPSYKLHVNGAFYASGNSSIGGTFGVNGATTLSSTLGVSGLLTASGGVTIPSGKNLKIGNALFYWDSTSQGIKITKPLSDYNPTSNFKTINGNSIIGTGDITIEGGSATKLYTSHLLTKRDLWFRFANLTLFGASYLVSIRDNYYNNSPTPVTWIINVGYSSATITLIGKVVLTPTSLTKLRIVRYSNNSDYGFHLEVYTPYQSYISRNTPEISIMNLGRNNMTDGIELVHDLYDNTKWLEVNENIQSSELLIEETDIPKTTTLWGQSFDGASNVSGSLLGVTSIEMNSDGALSGFGGFIDFHYNGSSADYTSRIIEDANGRLSINGVLYTQYGGNVGIGTAPSSSYKLYVNGNTQATNFYTTSDRNKKKNISEFSEHIRKFQLKGTEKWNYGVIAQEVEEMFREGKDGNMTVNYDSILSYYIGLLENKVKALEEKIRILETKNK